MNNHSQRNPLPPCPITPNCKRAARSYAAGVETVFEALTQILETEAHSYQVVDPKRIEIHAVYRIPIFGFKDDVDLILEEKDGKTIVFIRSASRLGAFDLFVNHLRVQHILRKIGMEI